MFSTFLLRTFPFLSKDITNSSIQEHNFDLYVYFRLKSREGHVEWEQSAEEDIWTRKRGSVRRVRKTTHWGAS